MFNNRIFQIDSTEIAKILQESRQRSAICFVEIYGKGIQSWKDFISEVEKKLKFPTTCIDSIDRYLDWIRDLSWLDKDEYMIIIYDYHEFMKKDSRLKNEIIEDFEDIILPWWQQEVEVCVMGWKAKPFNLYLVD